MKNTETLLIECLETVGNKISNCEYLRGLLKKSKKFEGWFQIVLACCLDKMLSKNDKEDVLVEHFVGDNDTLMFLLKMNKKEVLRLR